MKRLHDALMKREAAGIPVQFWLRDDDVIEPTPALDHLLELANRFAVPMTLASIPAASGEALAERLAKEPYVTIAVHGWSHQNHAPADEKKQELGWHRPRSIVLEELVRGREHLAGLYGQAFMPLLVPPWNRIDGSITEALSGIGLRGLSTFGQQSFDGVPMMNTHVDIIDWKGSRGGRELAVLDAEIVEHLEFSNAPIGILTHHLVHDDSAWAFLEQLFATTSTFEHVSWARIDDLLPSLRPDP